MGESPAVPAAFIMPKSGVTIEIFDISYDLASDQLERYQERIEFPSGASTLLKFDEIDYEGGSLVKDFKATIDGQNVDNPSKEESENLRSTMKSGFAVGPSPLFEDATMPLGETLFPCTGNIKRNMSYDYTSDGTRQVSKTRVSCGHQKMKYKFDYSDYTYQRGVLRSFKVTVESSPEE